MSEAHLGGTPLIGLPPARVDIFPYAALLALRAWIAIVLFALRRLAHEEAARGWPGAAAFDRTQGADARGT